MMNWGRCRLENNSVTFKNDLWPLDNPLKIIQSFKPRSVHNTQKGLFLICTTNKKRYSLTWSFIDNLYDFPHDKSSPSFRYELLVLCHVHVCLCCLHADFSFLPPCRFLNYEKFHCMVCVWFDTKRITRRYMIYTYGHITWLFWV